MIVRTFISRVVLGICIVSSVMGLGFGQIPSAFKPEPASAVESPILAQSPPLPPPAAATSASPAPSPSPAPTPNVETISYQSDFPTIRAVGGLGLVLSLILGGFFAAKKLAPQYFKKATPDKTLKMLECLPMGDKRSIALIQVEEKKFLVGNTARGISLLAELASVAETEAPRAGDSFRTLYEVEKKSAVQSAPNTLPPDVRAKMRQLREALER